MEVKILSTLKTELLGNRLWVLLSPFWFEIDGGIYTIPRGFVYDGNSAPRIAWSLCAPASGSYAKAGPVHDYLYSLDCDYSIPRKTADKVHMTIGRQNKAGWIRAKSVYRTLRMGGGGSYRKMYSIDKLTEKDCFDLEYAVETVMSLKKPTTGV